MQRIAQWEHALAEYLAPLMRDAEFVWGKMDCALFMAGAVQAMTGVDVAAAYRGKYRSVAGSVRALNRYGAGTLEATMDATFEPCGIGFARRGDLAMHDGSIGVCIGSEALFVGQYGDEPGLVRIARHLWTKAWRV